MGPGCASRSRCGWRAGRWSRSRAGPAPTVPRAGGEGEPPPAGPAPDGTEGGRGGDLEPHTIALPATTVDGAVLTVVGWTAPTPEPGPPPEPGPGPDPVPVDSSSTH